MKRIISILMAATVLFAACEKEQGGGSTSTLTADFTISVNPCVVGEEVAFDATVDGGKAPYTFNWTLGTDIVLEGQNVKYTFEKNQPYIVKLVVTDAAGSKVEKRKNLVVNPAPVQEAGNVTLNWAGWVKGYNAISTPAIADDGSVYATSQSNILYKFDKDGKLLWEKNFGHSDVSAKTQGTPSIDADGTVYIGTGTANGSGKVIAFNPDGSIKWEFKDFWAPAGSTPAPSYQYAICGIGQENIYFGNTGTAGSAIAVSKADGKRVAWCQNEAGTGGPGGGVRTGVLITKDNMLHWYGGEWGLWGWDKTSVDRAANSGVVWSWGIWNNGDSMDKAIKQANASIAALTVNGKVCVAGLATDGYGTKIYAVESKTGNIVCKHYIEDTAELMDQGGVVVTKEGYIVAGLNFTNGHDDGGIIIVDPSTEDGRMVARYRVQEKVSGAPAIDAAGNIHFASEAGQYYVVKLEGNECKLVVKRDLKDIVATDARYTETFGKLDAAKVWSSVVIGDDGKVYIQFTNNDSAKLREYGALVCLSVEGCTAPGQTEWPMMGHDRRHTNAQ